MGTDVFSTSHEVELEAIKVKCYEGALVASTEEEKKRWLDKLVITCTAIGRLEGVDIAGDWMGRAVRAKS